MSVSEKKNPSETKPKTVPKTKTESQSENTTPIEKTEAKSDAKDPMDQGAAGYSIGERQKAVTNKYRQGWDSIFGKKR